MAWRPATRTVTLVFVAQVWERRLDQTQKPPERRRWLATSTRPVALGRFGCANIAVNPRQAEALARVACAICGEPDTGGVGFSLMSC